MGPFELLGAAQLRLPPDAAFSGRSAAWLHGLDVQPCAPIEVTVSKGAGISGRSAILLRRSQLGQDVLVRGFPATAISRTLSDLSGRLSLTEAVVLADEALHKRLVGLDELTAWARANPRRHGIRALRRVIALAEPAAESPMETRLRMILILGGLPRPMAQVPIHDQFGRFVGRPDLFYQTQRLGIEYDGDIHRSRLAEDNRRQNRLLSSGVRLLRFTAADVLGNPGSVVGQVRYAISAGTNKVRSRPSGESAGTFSLRGASLGAAAPVAGAPR